MLSEIIFGEGAVIILHKEFDNKIILKWIGANVKIVNYCIVELIRISDPDEFIDDFCLILYEKGIVFKNKYRIRIEAFVKIGFAVKETVIRFAKGRQGESLIPALQRDQFSKLLIRFDIIRCVPWGS